MRQRGTLQVLAKYRGRTVCFYKTDPAAERTDAFSAAGFKYLQIITEKTLGAGSSLQGHSADQPFYAGFGAE